jgi:hypothetical protein
MRADRASKVFVSLVVAGAATLTAPAAVLGAEPVSSPTSSINEARPRILVFVSPTGGGEMLPRLRAELAVAGFDLRLPAAGAAGWPPTRDQMEQLARRDAAVAALAFIPTPPPPPAPPTPPTPSNQGGSAIEIWVVDRVTGKTVVRAFSTASPGHGDEAELLAVSAVETLRATLMEINLAEPSRGEIPPPSAVRALVGAKPQRFAARLGPAIGYGRGLGEAWQLAIGVTAALGPRLRLGVDAAMPLTAAGVSGPEGQADVRLWLAGPFVELSLGDPASRAAVSLGVGAWAAALQMRGSAAAPYAGVEANVFTLASHVDLLLRWRLGRRLGLGALFSVALAVPEATVQFAGRDAARWGRPFGLAALVVEARLD